MNKAKVIEVLDKLPEEFSMDQLVEKLKFIEKVERGIRDMKEEKVIHLSEVREHFNKKW